MLTLLLWLGCRPEPVTPPAPTLECELPEVPTSSTGPTGSTGSTTSSTPAPPRILLVTMDTTRADHFGAWGDPRGLTPALDRFAAGAMRFSQAHSHAPWTKPSIGSVMTSLLPRDHGVFQWEDQLAEDQPTLATTLDAAGWTNEAYVAHSAFVPTENRFHLGFDHFELSWLTQPDDAHPTETETSAHLTDLAIAALERLRCEPAPSLLWVHYFDPHEYYLHHDELVHLGDDNPGVYAEEIAWTDHQLDRLLQVAEADPELIVVIVADHGDELMDHGMNGHTHTVYEELVHVPLLLRAPGFAPGVCDTPVGTMDLAPTLLDLVGVPIPAEFQGRPLLPVPESRPLFAETRRIWDVRGMIDWPYKIVWDFDQHVGPGHAELYDLREDPGEQHDLVGEQPKRAASLLAELAATFPEVPAD